MPDFSQKYSSLRSELESESRNALSVTRQGLEASKQKERWGAFRDYFNVHKQKILAPLQTLWIDAIVVSAVAIFLGMFVHGSGAVLSAVLKWNNASPSIDSKHNVKQYQNVRDLTEYLKMRLTSDDWRLQKDPEKQRFLTNLRTAVESQQANPDVHPSRSYQLDAGMTSINESRLQRDYEQFRDAAAARGYDLSFKVGLLLSASPAAVFALLSLYQLSKLRKLTAHEKRILRSYLSAWERVGVQLPNSAKAQTQLLEALLNTQLSAELREIRFLSKKERREIVQLLMSALKVAIDTALDNPELAISRKQRLREISSSLGLVDRIGATLELDPVWTIEEYLKAEDEVSGLLDTPRSAWRPSLSEVIPNMPRAQEWAYLFEARETVAADLLDKYWRHFVESPDEQIQKMIKSALQSKTKIQTRLEVENRSRPYDPKLESDGVAQWKMTLKLGGEELLHRFEAPARYDASGTVHLNSAVGMNELLQGLSLPSGYQPVGSEGNNQVLESDQEESPRIESIEVPEYLLGTLHSNIRDTVLSNLHTRTREIFSNNSTLGVRLEWVEAPKVRQLNAWQKIVRNAATFVYEAPNDVEKPGLVRMVVTFKSRNAQGRALFPFEIIFETGRLNAKEILSGREWAPGLQRVLEEFQVRAETSKEVKIEAEPLKIAPSDAVELVKEPSKSKAVEKLESVAPVAERRIAAAEVVKEIKPSLEDLRVAANLQAMENRLHNRLNKTNLEENSEILLKGLAARAGIDLPLERCKKAVDDTLTGAKGGDPASKSKSKERIKNRQGDGPTPA